MDVPAPTHTFRGEHVLVLQPTPGMGTRSRVKTQLTKEACQAKFDEIYNKVGENGETASPFSTFANQYDSEKLTLDWMDKALRSSHSALQTITESKGPRGTTVSFTNSWSNGKLEFANAFDCSLSLLINTYSKASYTACTGLLYNSKRMGYREEQRIELAKGLFAVEQLEASQGKKTTQGLFGAMQKNQLSLSPFVSTTESLDHAVRYGAALNKGGRIGSLVEGGAFVIQLCRPDYNSTTGKLTDHGENDLDEFHFGTVKEFELTPNAIVTANRELHTGRMRHEREVIYSGSAGTPTRTVQLRVPSLPEEYDQNVHRDEYGLQKNQYSKLRKSILFADDDDKFKATEKFIEGVSTHLAWAEFSI